MRCVGVSGQQHGLVAVDGDGVPVRPCKLWCDTESRAEAAELSATYGWAMAAGFTASKALWLKRNEPHNWERTRTVLLPHNYVNLWLCGVASAEAGDASGVGVLAEVDGAADGGARYDAAKCAAVDERFLAMLPPLAGHDDLLERDGAPACVLPEALEALGLPSDARVRVSAGSGDNMCSALGAGACVPGRMVLSLGTSGTLFGCSEAAVSDATGTVAPFRDATGHHLPLLCLQNCTSALNEVARGYGMPHEELARLAADEPPGCGGLTFLPYVSGERTPNWPHATGALLGVSPGLLRPGAVYRAALEGVTFALLAGYDRMRELGVDAKELRLVGGGSSNKLWRQIIADAFQLPLRFPAEPESAALGAALQAAAAFASAGVGSYVRDKADPPLLPEVVEPDAATAAHYAVAFQRHQALGKKLFDGE